jgi:hypothetical protein
VILVVTKTALLDDYVCVFDGKQISVTVRVFPLRARARLCNADVFLAFRQTIAPDVLEFHAPPHTAGVVQFNVVAKDSNGSMVHSPSNFFYYLPVEPRGLLQMNSFPPVIHAKRPMLERKQ